MSAVVCVTTVYRAWQRPDVVCPAAAALLVSRFFRSTCVDRGNRPDRHKYTQTRTHGLWWRGENKLSARSSLFVFTVNNEDERLCVDKVRCGRVSVHRMKLCIYEYTNIWNTARVPFENNISVGRWQMHCY